MHVNVLSMLSLSKHGHEAVHENKICKQQINQQTTW